MVHNGIEYADMQLIGEAYQLLRDVAGYSPAQIADIFRTWNTGRLDSYLIEITAEVLSHVDAATGKPFVDVVQDQAEQKGTGRWTVQIALDLGVPVSGIAEAVFARSLSGHTELRERLAGARGPEGHGAVARPRPAAFADQVEQALYASKIVSYTQGFHEIAAGSDEYDWNIDLGAVASIWRGGCIIRAAFLDRIRAAYDARADLPSLLSDETFAAGDRRGPGRLAGGSRRGRRSRACPRPGSPLPSLTTTRCVPSACPRRSRRGSGTSSARTRIGGPTGRGRSTRCGVGTGPR